MVSPQKRRLSDDMRVGQLAVERTKVALRDSFNSFRNGLPAQAPTRLTRASTSSASIGVSLRQQKSNVSKTEVVHKVLLCLKTHDGTNPSRSRANSSPLRKHAHLAFGEPLVVGAIIAVVAISCLSR